MLRILQVKKFVQPFKNQTVRNYGQIKPIPGPYAKDVSNIFIFSFIRKNFLS